jgi:hypothetical protein
LSLWNVLRITALFRRACRPRSAAGRFPRTRTGAGGASRRGNSGCARRLPVCVLGRR